MITEEKDEWHVLEMIDNFKVNWLNESREGNSTDESIFKVFLIELHNVSDISNSFWNPARFGEYFRHKIISPQIIISFVD